MLVSYHFHREADRRSHGNRRVDVEPIYRWTHNSEMRGFEFSIRFQEV